MIENTLITRSSRAMAVASGSGTPYATVRTKMIPASATPSPAGLSGTAVSSDPKAVFRHGLYDEKPDPRWYIHGVFA